MGNLCPVSPVSQPLQSINSGGARLVLKTDPASVAALSQQLQDVPVIQLSSAVWFVTARNLHTSHVHDSNPPFSYYFTGLFFRKLL